MAETIPNKGMSKGAKVAIISIGALALITAGFFGYKAWEKKQAEKTGTDGKKPIVKKGIVINKSVVTKKDVNVQTPSGGGIPTNRGGAVKMG